MSFRKVLLLGNGINRSFSSSSWNDVIYDIARQKNPDSIYARDKDYKSVLPLPLQAIVASKNSIDSYMNENKNSFYGTIDNSAMRDCLRKLLSCGFDDILTTNYSYELEIAATTKTTISDWSLDKIRGKTKGKKAEGKYFIHTYNEVECGEVTNRIWHIHGAAKNPSSMVIGHGYYGNLVYQYKNYFNRINTEYLDNPSMNDSWLDSFVLGDVYVLGCGLDPSEMDLWWLIDRKNREKAPHGKIYFYVPQWEREEADKAEKYELMKCYDIEIIDMFSNRENEFKRFYLDAINDIISIII